MENAALHCKDTKRQAFKHDFPVQMSPQPTGTSASDCIGQHDADHSTNVMPSTNMSRQVGDSLGNSSGSESSTEADSEAETEAETDAASEGEESDNEQAQSQSTFGMDDESIDSLSSTAEAAMELQFGRKFSLEAPQASKARVEESQHSSDLEKPAQPIRPTSNGHANGKGFHAWAPTAADGVASAFQGRSAETQPIILARQQSPAPWPMPEKNRLQLSAGAAMEGNTSGEDGSLEETSEEGTDGEGESSESEDDESIEEQGNPGDATGWGDLAGDGGQSEGSQIDDDYILSQLTRGVSGQRANESFVPSDSEIEEMSEGLSDYDEEDMIAKLTRAR